MEICPECGNRTLNYDPYLKRAKCLRMDCDYSRHCSKEEYSRLLESNSKNVAGKLSIDKKV